MLPIRTELSYLRHCDNWLPNFHLIGRGGNDWRGRVTLEKKTKSNDINDIERKVNLGQNGKYFKSEVF